MKRLNFLNSVLFTTLVVSTSLAATGKVQGNTAKSNHKKQSKVTSLKIKSQATTSYQTEAGVILPHTINNFSTSLQKIPLIGEVQDSTQPQVTAPVVASANQAQISDTTNPVQTSVAATPTVAEASSAKRYALLLYSARTSSLYLKDDGNDSQSADFMFVGSYKLTDFYKLSLRVDYSEDLKDANNSGVANTQLILGYGPFKTKMFDILLSTSAKLPTDETSKFASLKVGIGQSAKFIMTPEYLFSDKLGVELGLGVSRNFHDYQEAVSGAINTQYGSTQYAEFTWSFTDKLSVLANFTHKNTWSYKNETKDSFDFSQELGYQAHKNIALALGHNNAGSALKADKQSSNVEVLNENSSVVYGAVTLTY